MHRTLFSVLPTVRFVQEPSGLEKVSVAEAKGIKFPSIIRESMIAIPATHGAECEMGGVFFCFRFGSGDTVQEIGLELRGSSDPFPALWKLAGIENWLIVDDATGEVLSQNVQLAQTGWVKYRQMLSATRGVA